MDISIGIGHLHLSGHYVLSILMDFRELQTY